MYPGFKSGPSLHALNRLTSVTRQRCSPYGAGHCWAAQQDGQVPSVRSSRCTGDRTDPLRRTADIVRILHTLKHVQIRNSRTP